jgi:hypothetical protein
MIDGLAIYISYKDSQNSRRVLRLHEDEMTEWEQVDPLANVKPTLKLNGEAARALLDALTRHYQGAPDLHMVRSDLMHERGRVDKLLGTLSEIASRRQS